jgi:hypothetical protein
MDASIGAMLPGLVLVGPAGDAVVLRVYIFRARALISTCVGSEEDYFLFILEAKRDSVIPIIFNGRW